MYLVLTGRVVFPARKNNEGKTLSLRRFHSAKVESSWRTPISRAEIVLPRNVSDFEKQKVREIFKVGDPVEIWLGYNGRDRIEFAGYIATVGADAPIVITCEDEMPKVRRMAVNFTSKGISLAPLLKTLATGYEVDAAEGVELGAVRFSRVTLGQVLDELASKWHLHAYMRGKTLVVGKYYADDAEARKSLPADAAIDMDRFALNNSLKYRHPDEVRIKIKATSILKNGKRIDAETGEDNGDSLELNYYDITAKAVLEQKVKDTYARAKRGGFDGTLTTFGFPAVAHGMRVQLSSRQYPDRNGVYYAEGVVKTWGPGGYRQEIKMGGKAK